MKKFNDLFKEEKEILIKLEPKNYKEFLNFAKENDLTWVNGSKNYDLSNFIDHNDYAFIKISRDKTMGFVSAVCYLKLKELFEGNAFIGN